MVIIETAEEAEKISASIEQAKQDCRVPKEFKFSKSHDNVKARFFNAISKCQYKVRAIVVDKERIYSANLRQNKETFYNYFVKSLLNNDNDRLSGASVKIDGSGDRAFKKQLNRHLRSSLSGGRIKNIAFVDSQKNNLIQLADMTAGAIARSYNPNRGDGDKWLAELKRQNKIEDIWEFG